MSTYSTCGLYKKSNNSNQNYCFFYVYFILSNKTYNVANNDMYQNYFKSKD